MCRALAARSPSGPQAPAGSCRSHSGETKPWQAEPRGRGEQDPVYRSSTEVEIPEPRNAFKLRTFANSAEGIWLTQAEEFAEGKKEKGQAAQPITARTPAGTPACGSSRAPAASRPQTTPGPAAEAPPPRSAPPRPTPAPPLRRRPVPPGRGRSSAARRRLRLGPGVRLPAARRQGRHPARPLRRRRRRPAPLLTALQGAAQRPALRLRPDLADHRQQRVPPRLPAARPARQPGRCRLHSDRPGRRLHGNPAAAAAARRDWRTALKEPRAPPRLARPARAAALLRRTRARPQGARPPRPQPGPAAPRPSAGRGPAPRPGARFGFLAGSGSSRPARTRAVRRRQARRRRYPAGGCRELSRAGGRRGCRSPARRSSAP